MTETVKGQVTSKSRAGTGIQIDKGSWYNGSKEMLANVAWKATVEAEVDGKQIKSIKVLSARDEPQAAPQGDYKDRQNAIEWQSSRRDAIQLARDLVELGLVKMPAAADKKYDAYLALVWQLNTDLYNAEVPAKGADNGE